MVDTNNNHLMPSQLVDSDLFYFVLFFSDSFAPSHSVEIVLYKFSQLITYGC